MLDSYIASHRCNLLFHIYEQPGKKHRFWRCYTEKNKLLAYQMCKKNLGIMPMLGTRWKGKFYVKKDEVARGVPYNTFPLKEYEEKKNNTFEGKETNGDESHNLDQVNYKKLYNDLRITLATQYSNLKYPLTIKNNTAFVDTIGITSNRMADWLKLLDSPQILPQNEVVGSVEDEEDEEEDEIITDI
jgi:hypothetical protein